MAKRQGFNEYKILNDNEAEFYITNRKKEQFSILVDIETLNKLINFNRMWHVVWFKSSHFYYVRCCENLGYFNGKLKQNMIYLHRWILSVTDINVYVDHINYNTLDNRKSNLRKTDISDNSRHRSRLNSNNKTGYRNVCWMEKEGNYIVQLMVNGKNTRLGSFTDIDEAGQFAEKMREQYYGEFKGTN